MSAGFSDMYGLVFLSDWKLIIRFVTSDYFRPCGAARILEVGWDVSGGWKFLQGGYVVWVPSVRKRGEYVKFVRWTVVERAIEKKKELKCVFRRNYKYHIGWEVDLICKVLSRHHRGYFELRGPGLSSISSDRSRRVTSQQPRWGYRKVGSEKNWGGGILGQLSWTLLHLCLCDEYLHTMLN